MDRQRRRAEGGGRAAVRRGVVGNLMMEVAPYTAAAGAPSPRTSEPMLQLLATGS
jgi:hypothetical protein